MGTLFIDACRRRQVERTPVWFMRQAGRYLPSYRRIRREKSVLEIAKDPELASKVTVDAVRQLGVDAAVVFADIMLPLEGIGVGFRIDDGVGPIVTSPVREMAQVEALGDFDADERVPYVLDTVERSVRQLGETPLIGFSGGPFTLAGYMIEGIPSREFLLTRRMMKEDPETWKALMKKLAKVAKRYLAAQVRSGARAVQVFDSWVGCLSPADYEKQVLPFAKEVFEGLPAGVPKIHFCANSGALLESFASNGCDVVSVDWRVPLDDVWERTGGRLAVQGNLDPVDALVGGRALDYGVANVLRRAEGRRGHVFNLGHGVLKDTPPDNLRRVVVQVRAKTGAR